MEYLSYYEFYKYCRGSKVGQMSGRLQSCKEAAIIGRLFNRRSKTSCFPNSKHFRVIALDLIKMQSSET